MTKYKISAASIIYWSLITLPITFKLELMEGLLIFPQELALILGTILFILEGRWKVPKYISSHLALLIALFIIIFSTFLSFINSFEIIGLGKTLKYILYIISIIIVTRSTFSNFISHFNKIAFISILINLSTYIFNLLTFDGSLSLFFHAASWDINYVPSGLSNLSFSLADFSFNRQGGNHGIYGSYLILIYLLNVNPLISKTNHLKKSNVLLVTLSIFCLALLTSREAMAIFLIVNFLFLFHKIAYFKVNKFLAYTSALVIIFVIAALLLGLDTGIIHKVKYTIESYASSGGEHNINARFGIWEIIVNSYLIYPINFLTGYGYNSIHFESIAKATSNHFPSLGNLDYATIPESFFLFFLAYGGILALIFVLIFWSKIIINTFRLRRKSTLHTMFFYFTLSLFLMNNTGGSMLSDILLANYSLTYIYLNISQETPIFAKNKH